MVLKKNHYTYSLQLMSRGTFSMFLFIEHDMFHSESRERIAKQADDTCSEYFSDQCRGEMKNIII